MKRVLGIGALIFASGLAACGGGGGPSPAPIPTMAPKPVKFTAAITWTGQLSSKTQSGHRRFMSLMPMDASVSGPVLLTAHSSYNSASNDGAVASVQVSPQPSSSPVPTWTVSDPNVQSTPGSTGSLQVQAASASTSSGTIDASLPAPLSVNAQANDYVYGHLLLECHHIAPVAPDNAPSAYAIQNGQIVEATDPSTADIYVDGPNCYGAFHNAAETDATIHVPGGAVLVSAYTPINTLTSAAFTGSTVTSFALNSTQSAPSPYAIIFQDRIQSVKAKLVLEVIGNDYPDSSLPNTNQQGTLDGPFCVFGSCVDGTT